MNKTVDKKVWRQRVQNLLDRRATGVQDNRKGEPLIADYARHLRSFELGASLLDVGCGDMNIKKLLEANHPGVEYLGVDAFPVSNDVTRMEIEDDEDVKVLYQMYGQFDNVICFAVLDGSYDLQKATANMKRLARKSVVILTGIDIEPDEFHTFKITQEGLDELMLADGWIKKMSNYLTPQVLLVEYIPPADRDAQWLFDFSLNDEEEELDQRDAFTADETATDTHTEPAMDPEPKVDSTEADRHTPPPIRSDDFENN